MIKLTSADKEYCRDITLKVLDRTLHDYAETASWASGSGTRHSDVEHDGWKKLRSQDNVSMYAGQAVDSSLRGGGWRHPVAVVAVGRMCCSLHDVLYSLVVSDPAEIKLRAVLMSQKVEDDVEIAAINTRSTLQPFQFMGVTRYLINQGCLHRPQEYVLVTAIGEVFTSCGEHLGYEIIQSVPSSRWSVSSTATRKRIIQARVLRKLPDDSVGVYYKVVVDSSSFMPDTVVQVSLWHDILNFWKMAPRCADSKNICYCIEHAQYLNLPAQHSPCISADPFNCGVCDSPLLKCRRRSLGDLASAVVHGISGPTPAQAYRCVLCSLWLCSKSQCRVVHQIARIDRQTLDVNRQKGVLCATCVDIMRMKSSAEIARRGLQEIHNMFDGNATPYAGSCEKGRASQAKVNPGSQE
ncbi:unnamed protein product [Phytophthora fragariaefolia]|uniref:Unnamed protein product n=1 Tax=Phytophthora fragariaefolia TaxID=1490495 RepID=A0A9W6U3C2_9STRA|nr:unnamed protein product [Phytophthora fragariaefolia]